MSRKEPVTIFLHQLVNRAVFVDANCLVFALSGFCLHIKLPQVEGSFAHGQKTLFFCCLCGRSNTSKKSRLWPVSPDVLKGAGTWFEVGTPVNSVSPGGCSPRVCWALEQADASCPLSAGPRGLMSTARAAGSVCSCNIFKFSSVQSLRRVRLFATP